MCTGTINSIWQFLAEMRNNLSQDPLLEIYLNYASSYHRDTGSAMTIDTLFTTYKNSKQPRCSSTEERINKMYHNYTMVYYSVFKINHP